MPFLARAGDANLTGYQCQVCDSEVGSDQPVYADYDGEVGERTTAAVWCAGCYSAVQKERCDVYAACAETSRNHGVPELADLFMQAAKRIAAAMVEATR